MGHHAMNLTTLHADVAGIVNREAQGLTHIFLERMAPELEEATELVGRALHAKTRDYRHDRGCAGEPGSARTLSNGPPRPMFERRTGHPAIRSADPTRRPRQDSEATSFAVV